MGENGKENKEAQQDLQAAGALSRDVNIHCAQQNPGVESDHMLRKVLEGKRQVRKRLRRGGTRRAE